MYAAPGIVPSSAIIYGYFVPEFPSGISLRIQVNPVFPKPTFALHIYAWNLGTVICVSLAIR